MAKKLSAVLLFWAISAMAQLPPHFLLDASVDASRLNLGPFIGDIWPVMMQVMTPAKVPTEINIRFTPRSSTGDCLGNRISLGDYPGESPTFLISNLNQYSGLVHEMAHVISYCGIQSAFAYDPFLAEGYATAVTNITYQKLAETFPQVRSSTALWEGFARNYLPLQVGGGSATFYLNNGGYTNAAAPFEFIAYRLGGNLKRLDEAINLAKPQNRAEYLAVVDSVVGKIDGVLPSTLFNAAPVSFLNGPDGTFFGIEPLGNSNPEPTDSLKLRANTPVNASGFLVHFFSRQGGVITPKTGRIRWTLTRASDSTMLRSGTDVGNIVPSDGYSLTNNLPEGGYAFRNVCILKDDNTCDPEFTDTGFFPTYSKPWHQNKVLVIGNSGRPLRVVDAGGSTSVEVRPDLLVLTNAMRDIVVTDEVTTRTITPTQISRIMFFTDRDQPWLKNVVNAATFQQGPVVPGSIATLFTWDATQVDPEIPTTNPLPTAGCDGRTKVIFTGSDRRELAAPFFYCSQTQLNVQVPRDLRGPTAWVRVQLGETFSNQVEVQVADANPGIFVVDPETKTGAVISTGQLVTRNSPAHPGGYLEVYATGLGETTPPLPGDGIAPPPPPPPSIGRATATFVPYSTLRPVLASTGGTAWKVLWSGLTPGFVGLYQVNVQVPEGLSTGIYPFILTMEGTGERRTSNEILIAVQ